MRFLSRLVLFPSLMKQIRKNFNQVALIQFNFYQLTVAGAISPIGRLVVSPAEEGRNIAIVTATIQNHNMAAFLAMEMIKRRKDAIFKYVLVIF